MFLSSSYQPYLVSFVTLTQLLIAVFVTLSLSSLLFLNDEHFHTISFAFMEMKNYVVLKIPKIIYGIIYIYINFFFFSKKIHIYLPFVLPFLFGIHSDILRGWIPSSQSTMIAITLIFYIWYQCYHTNLFGYYARRR